MPDGTRRTRRGTIPEPSVPRPPGGRHDPPCGGKTAAPSRAQRTSAMRLTGPVVLVLGALLGLLVVFATDQIVPAASQYQAQMRLWLAARATGLTAYVLLTILVVLGLVLSHPVNQSTWKLSKRLFPWHENLFVFVVAFLARPHRQPRARSLRRGRDRRARSFPACRATAPFRSRSAVSGCMPCCSRD